MIDVGNMLASFLDYRKLDRLNLNNNGATDSMTITNNALVRGNH